ncbi:MAG: hypothetical protein ACRDZ6_06595 [Acidimicrobiales bacterium]
MRKRTPPRVTSETTIGADVDLDRDDVRLPSGKRLTTKLAGEIVDPATEEHPQTRAALRRLARWGAATTYPLLLHLFDLRARGAATAEEVAEPIGYVESFLVRRMVVAVPTNNLNRIFASLIPRLPAGRTTAAAVRQALSETRKHWPSDQRLRTAIPSRPFYFGGRPVEPRRGETSVPATRR